MQLLRFLYLTAAIPLAIQAQARIVETVVPGLVYDHACVTRVELRNLANRQVTAEAEGHRGSGSLAPFTGSSGSAVALEPGERRILSLELPEETDSAWLRVRENVPTPSMNPALAITARTECVRGNELVSSIREAASPLRNPWFSGEVSGIEGELLVVVNVSERAALMTGCYESGTLISVPDAAHTGAELRPLCAHRFRELLPAFTSRRYPVSDGSNSRFSISAAGEAVVVQMLHRLEAGVQLYRVNTSINFGGEAAGGSR